MEYIYFFRKSRLRILLIAIIIHIVNGKDVIDNQDNTRLTELVENENIKNTWENESLIMCTQPNVNYTSTLYCEIRITNRFDIILVEYLSLAPTLLRLHKFGTNKMRKMFQNKVLGSEDVERQHVEGASYSPGHHGRVADGLWMEHYEEAVIPLFNKLQQTLKANPGIAENFLILKYDKLGHYAPHYDHLFPMKRDYDQGWFEFFGNRMATALFIVKTAEKGGGTVFPKLNLTIQPEEGDLILWFNADSNDEREMDSLHAACPIESGQKIAVSLWIRGNFQDGLKSSLSSGRYDATDLIYRRRESIHRPQYDSRPQIPQEYSSYEEDEGDNYEDYDDYDE